ncbi:MULTISPECIES: recombinase family protein [Rhodopirellula]|uniref:recombinase family protein n=1 Tax=Rhodopirellula TaxID=265488 RepID=UPI00257F4FBD|nr:recombinase family protein [Rhodopirellula sp. UBA1907]
MSKKHIAAVAYYRRSTKKQEASIEDQRTAVEAYAKQNGYKISFEYVDDGISGDATEKRVEFLRMRDHASSGNFDVVLCWDQDRFGRFDSLEAGHWCYPFRQAGVRIVTVNNGPIDWSDFTGRMMYSMQQEAKHQYLQDLSRNVLRGQIEAAKAGSWIGSPPYAYRIEGGSKNKRLVPGDPVHVATVRRIFHEYVEEQRTLTDIARRLTADGILSSGGSKQWKPTAVRVILANPAYTGLFRSNTHSYSKYHGYRDGQIAKGGRRGPNDESDWIVFEDHHPPLVGKRIFNRAQRLLKRNEGRKCRYTREENPYLLSGLLVCGNCGSLLWGIKNRGRTKKTKPQRYECSKRRREGKDACEGCTIGEEDLLDHLTNFVEENFIPRQEQSRLMSKAKQGKLTPSDLPKGFKKLKLLLIGSTGAGSATKHTHRKLADIESKIAKAQNNLVLLDAENIPAAQRQIAQLSKLRDQMRIAARKTPSVNDVNEQVLEVLTKLFWLCSLNEADLRPVLKEVERITVYATGKGGGSSRRYQFDHGDISFVRSRDCGQRVEP